MKRLASWRDATEDCLITTARRTKVPKVTILLALLLPIMVLACIRDDTPTPPPTSTATATVAPTATATPEILDSRPNQAIGPLNADDPQEFLSQLSPGEQTCLDDNGIGQLELAQLAGTSPGGSPDPTAAIIACLQDETVLRLFLTSLVGMTESFSLETSMCIEEGLVPLDPRQLLAPADVDVNAPPFNSLALGMAALNVSVVCMSDDEWETYAPRLGLSSGFREGAGCLFEELGGPAKLAEAMREASLGEAPERFIRAGQVCGLESPPVSTGRRAQE